MFTAVAAKNTEMKCQRGATTETVDLATYTEKILNGKLCSE